MIIKSNITNAEMLKTIEAYKTKYETSKANMVREALRKMLENWDVSPKE